jgi:hypothetical protein
MASPYVLASTSRRSLPCLKFPVTLASSICTTSDVGSRRLKLGRESLGPPTTDRRVLAAVEEHEDAPVLRQSVSEGLVLEAPSGVGWHGRSVVRGDGLDADRTTGPTIIPCMARGG